MDQARVEKEKVASVACDFNWLHLWRPDECTANGRVVQPVLRGLTSLHLERSCYVALHEACLRPHDRESAHLFNDCGSFAVVGFICNKPTGLLVRKSSLKSNVRARPERGPCNDSTTVQHQP